MMRCDPKQNGGQQNWQYDISNQLLQQSPMSCYPSLMIA